MKAEKEPQSLTEAEKLQQGNVDDVETSEEVGSSFEQAGTPEEAKEENPENVFINPEKELSDIAAQMETNEQRIDAIRQTMESDKKRMDEVRASLGLLPLDGESNEANHNNEELNNLEQEQERLRGEQENASREKELENVLKLLGALPKADLKIIIETGKGPDGKAVKTADGKEVNPEVAKKLAEAAENGVTKLTKALLGTLFSVVKGILKSIFAVVQIAEEAAQKAGGSEKV